MTNDSRTRDGYILPVPVEVKHVSLDSEREAVL